MTTRWPGLSTAPSRKPLVCMMADARHAVFVRDALNRFAGPDRHRRAAVPGPMPGWRRRWTRGHRSGDVGRAGAVCAQALCAGGDAARAGDRGGTARRRQRLRFNMAARRRARRDRAGRLLLAGVAVGGVWVGGVWVGGVWVGVEA